MCLGKLEGVPRRVIAVDRTGIRLRELHGAGHDGGQHRFGVER